MTDSVERSGPTPLRVRLLAYGLFVLLGLAVIELGARVIYVAWDAGLSQLVITDVDLADHLDRYEMVDPDNPRHWLLRAGTDWRLADLIEAKDVRDATLGKQRLTELQARHGLTPDQVVMRINSDGFKGPELDPTHASPRILALGDSCTFGTWLDKKSYPRTLERTLREQGHDVEVINGGVEGYSPRNHVLRLDEYRQLEAEIVTLYVGWNAIYSNRIANQHPLHAVRLIKTIVRLILGQNQLQGLASIADPGDPLVSELKSIDLPFFDDVIAIADELSQHGAQIVLLTLPGLFVSDTKPSDKALDMGHLPPYTNNPYALAALTENYNQRLRALAKDRAWALVDLEQWSRQALIPRDQYFFDSVHLEESGQQLIGEFLATQLAPMLTDRPAERHSMP